MSAATKKSSDDKKKKPAAKAKAVTKKTAPVAKKEVVKTTEKAVSAPKAAASSKPVREPQGKATPAAPVSAPKLKGIRIRLSAFDHTVLDEASIKIIDTAMRSGAIVHGPTPLPTKIRKFTVNRSTFVHKDARDQFEMRIHRRLIDLTETTFKTVDALQNLSLPSGVDIEIRMG